MEVEKLRILLKVTEHICLYIWYMLIYSAKAVMSSMIWSKYYLFVT